MGGASEIEGRLEVCFNKRWGTIDEDGWTHTDTQVACRQLGYSTSGIYHSKKQIVGITTHFVTSVACSPFFHNNT